VCIINCLPCFLIGPKFGSIFPLNSGVSQTQGGGREGQIYKISFDWMSPSEVSSDWIYLSEVCSH